jgi:UDP-N-acetylmuramoylalanine--D-glutamate ligase
MDYIQKFLNKPFATLYIWGMGKTGISIKLFFQKHFPHINLCAVDKINLSKTIDINFIEEDVFLKLLNQNNFCENTYIIPSPGIKLPSLNEVSKKYFITELDLFCTLWKKKIIAITGSAGKTSTTTLLGQILSSYYKIIVGGNIGIPLCDIIDLQNAVDFAILEVSSAQLEHTQLFNPDYVIWTNLFKNHINYHDTFESYYTAKKKILLHAQNIKKIFMHEQMIPFISKDKDFEQYQQDIIIGYTSLPINSSYQSITYNNSIVYLNDTIIFKGTLPHISYKENWLLIIGLLYELKIPLDLVLNRKDYSLPLNRLEYIGKFGERDVFNDSKATIMESTLCAYRHLRSMFPIRHIIILIGGLGKGVDRSLLIKDFIEKECNISIILFGAESSSLCIMLDHQNIYKEDTLKNATKKSLQISNPHDIILLAPGGSSFDEFTSYEERGSIFKNTLYEINF